VSLLQHLQEISLKELTQSTERKNPPFEIHDHVNGCLTTIITKAQVEQCHKIFCNCRMATVIQCLILSTAKGYRHTNFILKHDASQESEHSPTTSPARNKKGQEMLQTR
jgi:hypothetical protein